MQELTAKNFGLAIAYIIPGFIALVGASYLSPVVRTWLATAPDIPSGVEAIFFVTMASAAAGMAISAFRWATIDAAHHWSGLPRPAWDDAKLPGKLQAFEAIVESHFRYYQCYAHTAIALAFAVATRHLAGLPTTTLAVSAVIALEAILLAASRDALRRYYTHGSQLLGIAPDPERKNSMTNGKHPPKAKPKRRIRQNSPKLAMGTPHPPVPPEKKPDDVPSAKS